MPIQLDDKDHDHGVNNVPISYWSNLNLSEIKPHQDQSVNKEKFYFYRKWPQIFINWNNYKKMLKLQKKLKLQTPTKTEYPLMIRHIYEQYAFETLLVAIS